MPRPKPSALTGTAELNAMIERVAPSILELLADGVSRTKVAIVKSLALIRLAVTERVVESGGKYMLARTRVADSGRLRPARGRSERAGRDLRQDQLPVPVRQGQRPL